MNPEYYTEEFRNFKYLKTDPRIVERFKTSRIALDRIRTWQGTYSTDFSWPHVVEFVEQVFDLDEDNLYIVFVGSLSSKNQHEEANLIVVEKPIILDSNPILYEGYRRTESVDIRYIEDYLNAHYCLVGGKAFDEDGVFLADSGIFRVNSLPIAPKDPPKFTAMFYNKDTAELYRKTLTEMLCYYDKISSLP